jgi:hypothetical protein
MQKTFYIDVALFPERHILIGKQLSGGSFSISAAKIIITYIICTHK